MNRSILKQRGRESRNSYREVIYSCWCATFFLLNFKFINNLEYGLSNLAVNTSFIFPFDGTNNFWSLIWVLFLFYPVLHHRYSVYCTAHDPNVIKEKTGVFQIWARNLLKRDKDRGGGSQIQKWLAFHNQVKFKNQIQYAWLSLFYINHIYSSLVFLFFSIYYLFPPVKHTLHLNKILVSFVLHREMHPLNRIRNKISWMH